MNMKYPIAAFFLGAIMYQVDGNFLAGFVAFGLAGIMATARRRGGPT